MISWLVVIVAYVVALVVSWARCIQLYIYACFAPIPLSLLALDDTRQLGIGFLRNFASVCIAGIVILVILVSFPIVLSGLNAVSAGTETPIDSVIGGLSYALQYLAMCILLILSLIKSGTWGARHHGEADNFPAPSSEKSSEIRNGRTRPHLIGEGGSSSFPESVSDPSHMPKRDQGGGDGTLEENRHPKQPSKPLKRQEEHR